MEYVALEECFGNLELAARRSDALFRHTVAAQLYERRAFAVERFHLDLTGERPTSVRRFGRASPFSIDGKGSVFNRC